MSKVSMIHHVNVQIRDRQRTKDWYQKTLGLEFIDRGSVANKRQLQLALGMSELHFHETPEPQAITTNHFSLEVPDWEGTLAHLEKIGVPYTKVGAREYNGSYYTYLHDPDGNMIELVHHPLGLRWVQTPGITST